MAETSVNVNENILNVFDSLKGIDSRILFVISFIIIFCLLPLNGINTMLRLVMNQLNGIFNTAFTRSKLIILCFFPLNSIMWDIYYTVYKQILFACKLMFYPLLMGEWDGLKEIFDTYKFIIMYLIWGSAIYALWNTDFSPEYAYTVKLVPTIFYVLLLFGMFIKRYAMKK